VKSSGWRWRVGKIERQTGEVVRKRRKGEVVEMRGNRGTTR